LTKYNGNSRPEQRDRIVRLLLQLILMKMNRFYLPGNGTNSSRREAELVRRFLVNLEQNPKVASAVSSHAASLSVSPETLSETVKKETGKTPGTLIRERVLLEAKRLLLHTSLSVSEIAYQLLFKDPSYFNRFFRRATGKTPAEFRKECWHASINHLPSQSI
jgi:AraC family transcriptional regulator, transcriptional activator of pobA